MTKDLIDRLRRAADDEHRALPIQPAELLALARQERRKNRIKAAVGSGTMALAAGAALVATIVGIAPLDDSAEGTDPAEHANQHREDDGGVPLYLGPLSGTQTQRVLDECVRELNGDASAYSVVLAGRYDADWRPVDVVVATTADGTRVIDCVGTRYANGYSVEASTFDELPSAPPAPDPDAEHPLVGVSPSTSRFACDEQVNVRFSTDGVWKAADGVDRVEVRVVEPDQRQPWRVAPVLDGFVYWSGWSEGVLEEGDVLHIAWRAYDADGELIGADLMPVRSRERQVPTGFLQRCQNL